MITMKLVSVIIPTFNVEKDIKRCIDSIINQTYENIEIIIVDDCSSDQTLKVIQSNYSNNSKVKIYKNNKNSKAAFTRNVAINHSNGEFIAVQDADDYSHKDRIKEQVLFLNQNKDFSFVGTDSYSFDEKGIWKKTLLKPNPSLSDFSNGKFPFVHGSIMFRKEALKKVDNYRVTKLTERGQDADLLLRLYQSGLYGYNLNKPYYYYQENIDTVKKRSFKFRLQAVKNKLSYFPWSTLSLKEKIMIVKSLVIGLIPSRLWYSIMKFRARHSLKS